MPNSSPVLAGLITNVAFVEQLVNGAAQLLDNAVDFADVDGNFTGGDLIVSGLLPEDSVGIRNEGTAAGQIAVTGSNIRFGNVIIASFTGGTAGTPLVVTFNASATSAAVDALIQNLTYANSSDTPTACRNLVITIHDAAGAVAIPPTSFTLVTGLANPFDGVDVGGLSTPTFGDLDGDGDLDALIGGLGGTLRYFRNTGTVLAPVFAEQTGAANPFTVVNVGDASAPSFADLDGDGDLDAVVGELDGNLNYFRNTGTVLAPAFTQQTGPANPFNLVDVGDLSTPTFADLDGDGDLDVLIGNTNGVLNYFRNTGTTLAPVFVEQTGAANPFSGLGLFFATNPGFADIDGDGDLDAIAADFDGFLIYLRNTGTALAPEFAVQTGAANPFNGVNVGLISAPGFAALDGDGDLDLLIGEEDGTLNYVRNTTPAASTPGFAEQTGAANPLNGIDVGQFSKPTLADFDGDGDLDAVIGGNSGTLQYYRNTGTALAPVFTEQTGAANPFNGIDVGFFSTPSFADLDGDGDLDAVIGEEDGVINYYRNTGTALAPVFTEQTGAANPFNGINVGFFSTPSFADLDGDGDLDAVIGEREGLLKYYRNTGTALAPAFTEQTGVANPFDGIDVGLFSIPKFGDLDGDGDLDVLVGELDGILSYYRNDGTALTPVFTQQTGPANPFNAVDVGGISAPTFADLDGDGDLDAMIGEFDGVLKYYRNTDSGFVLAVNVTAQEENPFSPGDDVVNLNTLLVSGNFFLPDVISSLDGNDTVALSSTVNVGVAFNGGIGNDTITGGTGNDVILGGSGADRMNGDSNDDFLFGGAFDGGGAFTTATGADVVNGGSGNDRAWGMDGDDSMQGDAGDDFLTGGAGNDTLIGGADNDFLFGGDFVAGTFGTGSGNDSLDGGTGRDALYGFDGDDILITDSGDDYVEGGDGTDRITGGSGNSFLQGGAGLDTITGGGGFDYLYGQAGADVFSFCQGDSYDWVLDFSVVEGDRLRLDPSFGITTFAAFQSAIVTGATFTVLTTNGGLDQLTLFGVGTGQWTAAMVEFI